MSIETVRLVVFAVTYLAVAFPRLPGLRLTRPLAALVGAVAMVVVGRLPMSAAYRAIDFDVLTFILGVLILAAYLEIGGFFEWSAHRIARHAHSPRQLLAVIVAFTGVLSAFFMNDTLCLVLPPLVLAVVVPLGLPPLPYMLAVALSANVGSAMAITGNPQNMLIGIASGIGYGPFLASLSLASCGGLILVYWCVVWLFRRQLSTPRDNAQTSSDQPPPIRPRVIVPALIVFTGMLIAWLMRMPLPIVSITGAVVLLLVDSRDAAQAMERVDWQLLLFFAALFVSVAGIRDVPLVQDLTNTSVRSLGDHPFAPWRDASTISAIMIALSNLVSNVPAVLLWQPLVPRLSHPTFVWLTMAMSSTFAGNLSLLGSMANLIVAERAAKQGVHIGFWDYLRVGVPVTVLTTVLGIVVVVLTANR
jgi:Na+/H+ antiporter NhaD/arsenite permease-like protein